MADTIVKQAFTLSDSVYLVLLVGVSIGFWRFTLSTMRKNDERELRYIAREDRYIEVIKEQAKGLQQVEELRSDVQEIKHFIYKVEGERI